MILAALAAVVPTVTLIVVLVAVMRGNQGILLQVSNALGKLELSINGKVDKVMEAMGEVREVKGKVEGLIEASKSINVVERRKE